MLWSSTRAGGEFGDQMIAMIALRSKLSKIVETQGFSWRPSPSVSSMRGSRSNCACAPHATGVRSRTKYATSCATRPRAAAHRRVRRSLRVRPCGRRASVAATEARRVLLIIGGGIAAYKSLDLIRRLKERGFAVRCILTKAAQHFVTSTVGERARRRPRLLRTVRSGE